MLPPPAPVPHPLPETHLPAEAPAAFPNSPNTDLLCRNAPPFAPETRLADTPVALHVVQWIFSRFS